MRQVTVCVGGFVLLCSAGLAPSVRAQSGTYEMMAVVDQTNRIVRRIDPVTGTSYGSFGAGYLNLPSGIALRGDLAYVLDTIDPSAISGGRIRVFNYSTGVFLRSITLGGNWGVASGLSQLKLVGANYLVTDASNTNGAQSYRDYYSSTGASLSFFGGLGNTNFGAEELISSNLFYSGIQNSITWSSATTNSTSFTGLGSVSSPGTNIQLLRVENTLYALNRTNSLIRRMAIQAGGSLVDQGTIALTGFAPNSLSGLARGHGNVLYVNGLDAANPANGRIVRLDGLTGDFYGVVPGTYSPGLRSMDTVIAPEPGTLLALGVGLAALVRRRRSAR